jgi:hypothetical protein
MEAYPVQIHLLDKQIKKFNETLEHAKSTKLDAKCAITTSNISTERFNAQMPSFGVATYHFMISMRIWGEFDVFLNKMPVWRKIRDQFESAIDGLKEGLGSIKCRSASQNICLFVRIFFAFWSQLNVIW